MNSDTKPAVQSLSIWGAIAGLLGVLLPPILAHLHVTPADSQEIVQDAGAIIGGIGGVVAIWGRYQATTPLAGIVKSPPQ